MSKDRKNPAVLWSADQRHKGLYYRVVCYDDDCRFMTRGMTIGRKLNVASLEARAYATDAWSSVAGPYVEFLYWLPRSGIRGGKPYTWHSPETAVAYLQGSISWVE